MGQIAKTSAGEHEQRLRLQARLTDEFRAVVSLAERRRRDTVCRNTMVSWALRMSPTGWGTIREGRLVYTNHAFDLLDRGSLIGPGWIPVAPPVGVAAPSRSLREIAVVEARDLAASHAARRERRFVRAHQVVDLVVERPPAPSEDHVLWVLVRDVTQMVRTQEQLETLRARLIETERTRVTAELAVGVAHDLGNLVAALRAGLSLLPKDGALEPRLNVLRDIAEAQVALVSKLQAAARPKSEAPALLDLLTEVVRPALDMVETWLRTGGTNGDRPVSVEIDASFSGPCYVVAPRDELINVVINLFFNARDAMLKGGTIRVSARRSNGRVVLRIEDEGGGIPAGIEHRIFEPLFSTKIHGGMGMGLATAAALMRRLKGSIVARNLPDRGACLELAFVDPPMEPAALRVCE